jgi:L-threonylcarbamoyladenylate synthase
VSVDASNLAERAPVTPEQIERAARALSEGRAVVLPTDTVYGVFVRADRVGELHKLRPDGPAPGTWHAASADVVIDRLNIRTPVHLHLLRTLTPGPVRFLVEPAARTMREVSAAHPLIPKLMERDDAEPIWSVRVPDHDACRRVLDRVDAPIVADRVAGLSGMGDGVTLPSDAQRAAAGLGIAEVIDAGPTRYQTGSTTVRLTRDGWWKFEGAGAISEGQVRARVETSVLFVCTGNTCRSPMAEAVARHLLAKPGVTMKPTRVSSAGVSAFDGDPMTPEAGEALGGLGIKPGPSPHRATHLTRAMVEGADVIFAMTRGHAQRVLEVAPGAKDKIVLLDPSGRDIPDPIGGTLADYRNAAQAIAKFVEQRLSERGLILPPQRKGILETW